jgi:Dolichyl-phosphate-mannose-protein mannosyltransferase
MCFAKTTTSDLSALAALISRTGSDRRRPYHATRAEPRTGVRYGAGMARVETVDAPPAPAARFAHWRLDATILAVAAIVIRLPAFFVDRSLVFDDGVFASSALAMRAGEVPFRDIFSSQGPVFPPLLWVADLVGFRTMDAPRVLSVAAGVLLTVSVYACARRLTTRANALLAAGLVTTSGSVLWVTVPVNADGPSLALSVLAVAFALRYRDDPRVVNALWVGLAAGAAVSIKALSVPAVVIAGLIVLLSHRRFRDAAVAAGVAVAVYVVAALPFGIGRVWDQSYVYHQDSHRANTHTGAISKIFDTVWDRDLLVMIALVLAGIAFLVRFVVRRRAGQPGDHALVVVVTGLVLWSLLVVALLVWEPAMWRAHIAHLIPPLALLAALRPAPWSVLAIAGLVAAAFFVSNNRSILWPDGYTGHDAALVHHLERFPSDALFISDDPGWVWRSGHRPPGAFADTSFQRIDQGQITKRSLVTAAATDDVCGVISSSPLHFKRFHGLGDALAVEGYEPAHFGPHLTLFERTTGRCAPQGR